MYKKIYNAPVLTV